MIVLLLLLATARAVRIDSPAKWNIVDGVIPQGLDAEKGCHSGLRISETKPMASIPISCANIRYSVYDSSVATMGNDEVSIDRSYTERNVVSDNGVCKMHIPSLDSTTAADVYTKGQDMKFFSRYGYCDGTYTGTKHFTETTLESDRSCPEGSDTVERITISGFVLGKVSIGGIPQDLILTKGVNYEFDYPDPWDTIVITSDGNPIGTRVGFVLSVSHTELKGTLEYYNTDIHYYKQNIIHMPITMVEPGYLFPIYTEEECAFYTGKDVSVISDMAQPYGCWSDGTFNEFNREEDLDSLQTEVDAAKDIRKKELLEEWDNLYTSLDAYSFDGTVEDFVPEPIVSQSSNSRNIVEQINSAWAKFKYLRDLNAQLVTLDNTLLNMKADKKAYNEVVEKLKLYGVNKTTTFNLPFGLGNSIRTTMETKVASLSFDSEVSALDALVGEDCLDLFCSADTLNYGFPEYGDDEWYESALVKLGLKTKFIVDGPTSFKYLGTREPTESENYNSYGNYQERYEGFHHMPGFRSIYEELKNITSDWKNLREMSDYSISYENPDLTLSEVDREKRVEARDLSLSNIRARETAIARGLLNVNPTGLELDPLYESLVKLNLKCVHCQCYHMQYDMNNDKPDDIVADCKEQCKGHDGFLVQWDTSQPRVESHRDRHRSSCVCAGDGEPISELECVLANREWIPNIYTDQYELNPKDPTVKTGVQTKDVYLHCPGPMCSNGPTEGCWDDTICNVGEFCTEVSGTVSAVFKTVTDNQLKFLDNTTKIVHPQRLTSTTFLFRDHITKSQLFILAGGQYTRYTHYIVGITTDLDGNRLELKAYEKEGTYTNGPMTKAYWDSLQTSWGARSTADVSVQFGRRVVSEEGVWCDSGWFNNGCQEGCKPGFLEEDCSCGDSACKAGQYCTKDGVCKDVVKKEKKFLQIRYNSLE